MNNNLTVIKKYLLFFALAAIILQMSTGCIVFCALLGISPCAPEEPPPPTPRPTRSVGNVVVIPEAITLVPGTSDSIIVQVTNRPPPADDVTFALEGLPQGVSYTISQENDPNTGQVSSALLRIVADPAAPATSPSGVTATARTSTDGRSPDYDIVDATADLQVQVMEMTRQQTLPAVKIGAGASSSFAILTDGSLWSWGDNYFGQLGDGTKEDRLAPVPVAGLSDVQEVSGGDHFSMTLHGNSTLQSWGSDTAGRLGNGTYQERSSPQQVPNLPPVQQVSAGRGFTLALQNNATVSAWGYNITGQLGYGYLPQDDPGHANNYSATPRPIPGLAGVQQVSAGRLHSVALLNDGTVRAWGFNDLGQLGDGSTYYAREQPGPVVGLSNVQAVAAGGDHTLALLTDGTVRAWGRNLKGALGDGTRTDRATPVQVNGLANVQAIAAAQEYSLALLNDGTVWGWGWNENGQLGDGTATDRTTPVQVPGLTDVRAIAAGGIHSLALVGDCGEVWAWGQNKDGQLGDGSAIDRTTPAPVIGIGGLGQCSHHNLWLQKFGRGLGGIVSNTGNLDCGDMCYGVFAPNDQATLTAQLGPGSIFVNWLGDCGGTDPQTTVVMDQSRICQAVFQPDFSQSLYGSISVTTSGPGKVFYERDEDSETECPDNCSRSYIIGAEAELDAVPESGLEFTGWGGGCSSYGSDPTIDFPVISVLTCTANFSTAVASAPEEQSSSIVAGPYTLEVLRAGPSVGNVNGTGINCGQDCTEEFDPGASTSVTLTAEDDLNGGALFGSWLGCDEENGNQCTVTVDSSRNVTAFFLLARVSPGVIAPSTFDLTVATAGIGSGTIVAAGIDCGQDCSESYDDGSQVILTPQPDNRSVFAGWGGDADCSDGLVTLGTNLSCTGIFDLKTFNLNVGINGSGSGTVASSPNGINCGSDCDETYDIDKLVTLTASAGPDTQFVGWSGVDFDLAITRISASPQPAQVGEPITHEIDVTNLGVAQASDVMLTTFTSGASPTGQVVGPPPNATVVSFIASQGTCSQPNGASNPVECSLGDLPGNATATVTLVLTPNSPTLPLAQGLDPLTIGANLFVQNALNGSSPDVDPSNNAATVTTQVLPSSGVDLAVTMTGLEQGPVGLNSNLTLSLEIVNNGPDNASNLNLLASTGGLSLMTSGVATGPGASAALVSSMPSQGNCVPLSGTTASINCTLGSLASGARATVEVTIKPTSPTLPLALSIPPLSYNTQVFTRDFFRIVGDDLDPSNNEASIATHVLPASGADLAMSMIESSPALVPVGGNLTYSFEVINNGPDPAQGVLFTTLMNTTSYQPPGALGPPPDVTFVSVSTSQGNCPPPTGPSVPLKCALGTLSPGATVNISVVATANSPTLSLALGLLPLANTGAVFTQSALLGNDPDPDPSNNVASVSSRVLPGDCSGAATIIQIAIVDDTACLATFNQVHTLSLEFLGNGSGTVTGNQGALVCDQNCAETYLRDTLVTLTATPDLSSDFAVWTGDCSGTDPTIQVLISQDTSCTVHFNIDDDEPGGGSSSAGSGGGDGGGDDGGGDDDYEPPG